MHKNKSKKKRTIIEISNAYRIKFHNGKSTVQSRRHRTNRVTQSRRQNVRYKRNSNLERQHQFEITNTHQHTRNTKTDAQPATLIG